MSQLPRPVSEVYQPAAPNELRDAALNRHYETWGYSIGYEVDAAGQSVPEGGNTAVFRVLPMGMTEPVFVTKPEPDATFTINVLAGQGKLIRAKTTGEVEEVDLREGTAVVIRPGEAYVYKNTDEVSDLVLHDVALPAFSYGDDVELTSSRLYYCNIPDDREGYNACMIVTPEHKLAAIYVPERFFDLVGAAAATA